MEILQTLGVDWKLFIAQLVNFAILLFLLYRFLYRPLLGVMEKRQQAIEKSLADARAIEERLVQTDIERAAIIEEAKKEAARLLETANELGQKKRDDMLEKTKSEVAGVIADAKRAIAQEKEQMLEDAKRHLSDLVVDAAKRALQEGMETSVPSAVLEKAVQKANNL